MANANGIAIMKNGFKNPISKQEQKTKFNINQGIKMSLHIIVVSLGDSFPLKIEIIETTKRAIPNGIRAILTATKIFTKYSDKCGTLSSTLALVRANIASTYKGKWQIYIPIV